jgi:acyl carrier protein
MSSVISEQVIFEAVCEAVQATVPSGPSSPLARETPLRNGAVVNSLDFLRIFTVLEDRFDVDLIDETAGEGMLVTVGTLVEFLVSKLESPAIVAGSNKAAH